MTERRDFRSNPSRRSTDNKMDAITAILLQQPYSTFATPVHTKKVWKEDFLKTRKYGPFRHFLSASYV